MQNNHGFILITTIILLLITAMLMINLLSTSGLESKMAANFQSKSRAELDAENNLSRAETLIVQQFQSPPNSNKYSWQPWLDPGCPKNSGCFLVIAKGQEQSAQCTLQAIYVLEFQSQQNQRILERHYQLSWWPQAC